MSPVRKVLPKDNLAANISLGGALVDNIQGFEFLPVFKEFIDMSYVWDNR